MHELNFIFYLMPIINISIGILSLYSLSNSEHSHSTLFLVSLSGIFMLILNLYFNKYIFLNINDKIFKLFSTLSIFINFSIIPSLLFYIQFNFQSYKILNYYLLLLFPIGSSFALINDFIKNEKTISNYSLVILLYVFALITSYRNISNILPAVLMILVSMLMCLESFLKE